MSDTNQPTAIIRHPNHPEIEVTVQKLSMAQQLEESADTTAAQVATGIIDPRTGDLAKDKDGSLMVAYKLPVTPAFVRSRLTRLVKSWKGIPEDCAPENMLVLFDDRYMVTPADGGPRFTFAIHIQREAAKPEIFDRDPTVSSSEKPPI